MTDTSLHQPFGTALVPARCEIRQSADHLELICSGNWDIASIGDVDEQLRHIDGGEAKSVSIDTNGIGNFDTAGAWLIERLRRVIEARNGEFRHIDADKRRLDLVEVVRPNTHTPAKRPGFLSQLRVGPLETIGRFTVGFWDDFILICNIIGAAIRGSQMKAGKRGGIRLLSIINQLDHMALRAVPVIAVMSFLIGAIIAQQGAFQLKAFGEELLTVNLVGILLLREIGVLLTAIMVAGRTGSAITAELGSMKMREEIDALRVIGLNPVGVLIFPRLVALVIAMPILTLLADVMGLFGGAVVSWLYIGIPFEQFITALRGAIDLSTLFAGLIKAPFMAMIIALIAAVEGMKVSGSAESLGYHTTIAVVRSIFAVIVLDGIFAMFYAAIGY